MKNKPLISVILSVYNDQENITAAIKSILDQTYINIELLIVDDCSTDDTRQKIINFKDPRIKFFKNDVNLGLTKSLNLLIEKSSGEYLARQDSDDISHPERIDKQYQFLIEKKLDACTTRAQIKNSKKAIPRLSHLLPINMVMTFKNPFIHGTLLIRAKVIKNLGLYDEFYKYSQDYKLYVDLIKEGYKIKMLNEKLYILNTEQNISTINKYEQDYYFNQAKLRN